MVAHVVRTVHDVRIFVNETPVLIWYTYPLVPIPVSVVGDRTRLIVPVLIAVPLVGPCVVGAGGHILS